MKKMYSPKLLGVAQQDIYYTLTMFPYPSGYGLHVGHASVFTINDVMARYQRMKGKTVLNPFGFDSFGLPTENYAMQQGKPAWQVTQENIVTFLKQIEALDMSFDLERIFATSDPEYYKWTQWIFVQLYKAGLVYRAEKFVNRCPGCQTVLANDQVVDGLCERCKSEIIQKKHPQWFIKITDYAEKLLADLDLVDRPEETKQAQRNWIGKSEGAEIDFIVQENTTITCFTTRPDTLYGVTAVVLAPENSIIDEFLTDEFRETVLVYRKEAMGKTAVQRQQDTKEKSGVFSGIFAIHPLTGEQVPVWFADYVLMDYGTGAVMFVPAHDERDWEFAKVHGLDIIQVVHRKVIGINGGIIEEFGDGSGYGGGAGAGGGYGDGSGGGSCDTYFDQKHRQHRYSAKDSLMILVNSGRFNGLDIYEAKKAITTHLESLGLGKAKIIYKLRDWSVSRQRYWGSPIPMYYEYASRQVPYLKYDSKFGDWEWRSGEIVVNKTTVRGFLYHPKTEKYCVLYWKGRDIYVFPSGGVEEGESLEQGLRREILEETGYNNIKIESLIGEYIEDFYAVPKKRNQHIQMSVFLCELVDESNVGHAREAHEDFDVLRLSVEEILALPGIPATTMYCFQKLIGVNIGWEGEYGTWYDTDEKIYHPIPQSELPVLLPLDIANYKPKGKSPLEDHATFPLYTPNNYQVPLFKYTNGIVAVRDDKPTQARNRILAIIQNTETKKYLCIRYMLNKGLSCPTGGIEGDEDMENALRREVMEETGISELKHVRKIGAEFQSYFYAAWRQVNYYAHTNIWMAETSQSDFGKLDPKESKIQIPIWMSLEEIEAEIDAGKSNPEMNGYPVMHFIVDVLKGEKREYPTMVDKVNEWTKEIFGESKTYRRECDTLDTFMCSAFYFLRFPDAHNPHELIRKELADKMFPVDLYTGGKEHTVGHLLYSRFIHKFLYDQGYLPCPEPFKKLVHQGMVMGADGRKMGKRYGNVIDPIDVVNLYGSDAVRTYLMFMGPVDQEKIWNDNALQGMKRFLNKFERLLSVVGTITHEMDRTLGHEIDEGSFYIEMDKILHQTIQGVTKDIEDLKFNTAISKLMIITNKIYQLCGNGIDHSCPPDILKTLTLLFVPFAPKVAQSVWNALGNADDVTTQKRPVYDPEKAEDDEMTIPVQINGKRRLELTVPVQVDQEMLMDEFYKTQEFTRYIGEQTIKKIIYVKGKILNVVV